MKTKQLIIKLYLITISCLIALSSCHESTTPSDDELLKTTAEVHRTILVYMVADNSLGGKFDREDINEMLSAADAGDFDGGRLLIYHVPYSGNPILKEIKANNTIDTLKVYDRSELSVSAARMTQVIKDVKDLAPANDYGMILWSHASGWLQDGIEDGNGDAVTYSFGYDNKKTNRMNITTLAHVLNGEGMSFLYFDCCNMACVEVAYELRNVTKTFAGSVTELPAPGMPYDMTLRYLFNRDEADVVGAATATYNYYLDLYNTDMAEKGKANYPFFTITVADMSKLNDLAAATKNIYKLSKVGMPTSYEPQKFATTKFYFDLRDYLDALYADYRLATDNQADVEAFDTLMNTWQQAYQSAVLYTAGLSQMDDIEIKTNCGLSTYIMTSAADLLTENYNTLSWATDVASALINK